MEDVQCGEFAFMCCITYPEMLKLWQATRGMTENELQRFYRVACICTGKFTNPTATGGGTTPPKPL
jgi:hypothetical protein